MWHFICIGLSNSWSIRNSSSLNLRSRGRPIMNLWINPYSNVNYSSDVHKSQNLDRGLVSGSHEYRDLGLIGTLGVNRVQSWVYMMFTVDICIETCHWILFQLNSDHIYRFWGKKSLSADRWNRESSNFRSDVNGVNTIEELFNSFELKTLSALNSMTIYWNIF